MPCGEEGVAGDNDDMSQSPLRASTLTMMVHDSESPLLKYSILDIVVVMAGVKC